MKAFGRPLDLQPLRGPILPLLLDRTNQLGLQSYDRLFAATGALGRSFAPVSRAIYAEIRS